MSYNKNPLDIAHGFSKNQMKQLMNDRICGCFYCCKIFSPTEIEEWDTEDGDDRQSGTAICPYCGIDSVLGESSGFPITEEFLRQMYEYWFE